MTPEVAVEETASPIPEDFDEYQKWRNADPVETEVETKEIETKEPSEAAGDSDIAKTADVPETTDTNSGQDDKEKETEKKGEEDEADKEQVKGKGGFQRKIDKLTAKTYRLEQEKADLERRLADKPAVQPKEEAVPVKAETKPAPKLDDFANWDEFRAAERQYDIELATAAAEKVVEKRLEAERKAEAERKETEATQSIVTSWNKKVAEFEKDHADYKDLVNSIDSPPPILQRAIVESEIGPALAYHLANPENDELLEKVVALASTNPLAMARELGKIEASLAQQSKKEPEKPKTKVSAASEPIKPVGGASKAVKKPEEMGYEEHVRWRKNGGGN